MAEFQEYFVYKTGDGPDMAHRLPFASPWSGRIMSWVGVPGETPTSWFLGKRFPRNRLSGEARAGAEKQTGRGKSRAKPQPQPDPTGEL